MILTLGDLSERFNLKLRGDPKVQITGLASLDAAGQGDLTFLFSPKYRDLLVSSQAAGVCLAEGDAHGVEMPVLIAERPRLAWARIATLFDKAEQGPGIDASASIASSAVIGEGVAIGPHAVIRAGASIGENTVIGSGAVIGEESVVGSNTTIHANVVVYRGTRIGNECIIHANAVIGADGFGYEFDPEVAALVKIPQIYGVDIGDRVEIGAGSTIDRGALKNTVIEDGVKIDNQVQIGHGSKVGAHTVISGCTAIAGSTTIGRYCMIGGAVGIIDNITITDQVQITAMTLVSKSIDQPGRYSSGTGLMESTLWKKNAAVFKRLGSLYRGLRKTS